MKLPLLASVPHAGLRVPHEVAAFCVLTPEEVAEDGDVGAGEIYELEAEFEAYVTTDVARAIVDVNRAEDDRRADGVVKTHTCWQVPVYRSFPPEDLVNTLLDRYYRPFHERLRELARTGVRLGVDLHTMAESGPPIGPDPGSKRPWVCLGDAGGTSCPPEWTEVLRQCFEARFGRKVRVNQPFQGGFIVRSHAAELPWIQVELSRGDFMSTEDKRCAVLAALRSWCERCL